jgi:phosphatidylethanolamine-binding protein (PEBP) family uncharacterized protein
MKSNIKFSNIGKLYTLAIWVPDVQPQIRPDFVHWLTTNLQNQNNIETN